jgi:hypothetical protein
VFCSVAVTVTYCPTVTELCDAANADVSADGIWTSRATGVLTLSTAIGLSCVSNALTWPLKKSCEPATVAV